MPPPGGAGTSHSLSLIHERSFVCYILRSRRRGPLLRILLTNDDGVDSEGLSRIRHQLIARGVEVTTVAPEGDHSGVGRSCTYRTPVLVTLLTSGPNPVYVCKGTPIDSVRVGLLTAIAPDANLVVSGINLGANLGDDVTYSGTVGAGIEAALLGFPSVCLSQQAQDGRFRFVEPDPLLVSSAPLPPRSHDFSASATLGARLVQHLGETASPPTGVVLNINFPAHMARAQFKVTRLGRRYFKPGSVSAVHRDGNQATYFLFGSVEDDDPEYEGANGTDFAAVAGHHISVTPLTVDWGADAARDEAHQHWIGGLPSLLPATTAFDSEET